MGLAFKGAAGLGPTAQDEGVTMLGRGGLTTIRVLQNIIMNPSQSALRIAGTPQHLMGLIYKTREWTLASEAPGSSVVNRSL